MLSAQEAWRKSPCPRSIDMSTLSLPGNEGIVMLLLSIEDEFNRFGSLKQTLRHILISICYRCESTHFSQVHPTAGI